MGGLVGHHIDFTEKFLLGNKISQGREKVIDHQYLMRFSPCDMLGEKLTLTETPCIYEFEKKILDLIILKLQFFKEGEVSAGNHSIKIIL